MVRSTRIGDAVRRVFVHQRAALVTEPTRNRTMRRFVAGSVLTVAVALSVAACGSTSSSSGGGSSTSAASASSSTSGANVALAKAGLAQVTGHADPFPVTERLSKQVPPGSKFVYLEASDPIGALFATLLKPAVAAIGGKFIAIPAGETAQSAQVAASTAISEHPAVVLIPAFLPSEFGGKLQTLRSEGANIVGAGMVGWKQYGIQWCVGCETWTTGEGRVLADWVVANKGAQANAAFYTVPELGFTSSMWQGFKSQMATLCPKCAIRNVPIEYAAIGTTAPRTIVADLQSHSGTNVAVSSTMDMYQGLPAALSSAGIHNVLTVGQSPTAEILEDIKAGTLTAGLAVDLNTYVCKRRRRAVPDAREARHHVQHAGRLARISGLRGAVREALESVTDRPA